MSKLDDMQSKFHRVGYFKRDEEARDALWLLARVRKLEEALRNLEAHCLQANAYANPPGD